MRPICSLALLLVVGGCGEDACPSGTFRNWGQCATTAVDLPKDAVPHDAAVEWWYYTGHLAEGDNRFGFELTIFSYGAVASFMCHVAITDQQKLHHRYSSSFALQAGRWDRTLPATLDVQPCKIELSADEGGRIVGVIEDGEERKGNPGRWSFDLALQNHKQAALHGGNGIATIVEQDYESYYYSYTRLGAKGALTTPDASYNVAGQAWMDHQWGHFSLSKFRGWDWWSLQLSNNQEIMIYLVRDWSSKTAGVAVTIIDAAGNQTWYDNVNDVSIEHARSWTSPYTQGVYPLDWTIKIPPEEIDLVVTTLIDDQEVPNPVKNYWEGAVDVQGSQRGQAIAGQGYVELTGYAHDPLFPPPSAN